MQEVASSALVIANPAAGNGTGTQSARAVIAELETAIAKGRVGSFFRGAEVDAALLGSADQTRLMIESAADRRAIIVVGGDGLVHLAVNALMRIPEHERPALAVIPAGTGNDYARALGMPLDVKKATRHVLAAEPRPVDLGKCNGVYYAETLSFGIDAAIALDTVERRERTGRSDAGVYFSSGIEQLTKHLVAHAYRGAFDDRVVEGESMTFAVQLGPYYGGGFKVCPDAKLDDGCFDICISHPPVSVVRALYTFIRAKNGKHTGSRFIELAQARRVVLDFDEEPPCQIDGEPLRATHFEIECMPKCIRVLA